MESTIVIDIKRGLIQATVHLQEPTISTILAHKKVNFVGKIWIIWPN